MAKGKGSAFERELCVQLSMWWTYDKRDDVFWRTAGSGARAKTRSKTNQRTFGQYGDIQATDPIGQALIDVVSIEAKRGYSSFSIHDVLDRQEHNAKQTYEKFFEQAEEDATNANTYSWLLITRRDRRTALVFFPYALLKKLKALGVRFEVPHFRAKVAGWNICGTTLDSFLAAVKPSHIKKIKDEGWSVCDNTIDETFEPCGIKCPNCEDELMANDSKTKRICNCGYKE